MTCFLCICGMINGHSIVEIPDILFPVVYFDGKKGIVRGGSWIHEKAQSIRHLFPLLSTYALPKSHLRNEFKQLLEEAQAQDRHLEELENTVAVLQTAIAPSPQLQLTKQYVPS
ncbi:hypothetical protein N7539_008648 [Penicillium diatomitis]|uniref:Uncharacterized protein n=1 Tax=Penicillium diatomitis TaxID=2819901 RepID=A0A9W9WR61_9EURO|nr:uncharacterized protein N7539_008648 [Penicillium diatomitis]KAJ5472079.1 hypothetical protein N7539_008648 [Penicillium diatomitis]